MKLAFFSKEGIRTIPLLLSSVAGFLASRVMRGGRYGVIGDMVVGILGAHLRIVGKHPGVGQLRWSDWQYSHCRFPHVLSRQIESSAPAGKTGYIDGAMSMGLLLADPICGGINGNHIDPGSHVDHYAGRICAGTPHLIVHPNCGEERDIPREMSQRDLRPLVQCLSKSIETETSNDTF